MPFARTRSSRRGNRRRSPDARRRWRNVPMARRTLALLAGLALVAIAATPAVARNPNAVNAFHVQVLQSTATDPRLVNGWGIVAGPPPPRGGSGKRGRTPAPVTPGRGPGPPHPRPPPGGAPG